MNKIIEVEIKREEWPNGHEIWRGIEVTDEVWERVEAYVEYALRNSVIEDAVKEVVKEYRNPNCYISSENLYISPNYNRGDWLTKELAGEFNYVDNATIRFDHKAFTQVLVDNGVSVTGNWADLPNSGQKGWIGRYLMNGRQRLEIEVVRNGVLKLKGKELKPPKAWLNEMQEKHN